MQALYFTPNGASVDKAIGALPGLPVPVSYPQYGSMAMLPLQSPTYSSKVSCCFRRDLSLGVDMSMNNIGLTLYRCSSLEAQENTAQILCPQQATNRGYLM